MSATIAIRAHGAATSEALTGAVGIPPLLERDVRRAVSSARRNARWRRTKPKRSSRSPELKKAFVPRISTRLDVIEIEAVGRAFTRHDERAPVGQNLILEVVRSRHPPADQHDRRCRQHGNRRDHQILRGNPRQPDHGRERTRQPA